MVANLSRIRSTTLTAYSEEQCLGCLEGGKGGSGGVRHLPVHLLAELVHLGAIQRQSIDRKTIFIKELIRKSYLLDNLFT